MTSIDESMHAPGAHFQLNQMAGTWAGTTRTWFEPDKLTDESATEGYIRPYLNGRFMFYEYQGTLQDEKMQGTMIFGFNLVTGQYETAWVDNLHMDTGMMFSTGQAQEHGFSVLGDYSIGEGPRWGWRTVVQMPSPDELIVRAYNIAPDGLEYLGIETVYQRIN